MIPQNKRKGAALDRRFMDAGILPIKKTGTLPVEQIRTIGIWLSAWIGLYYLCLWGFAKIPDWGAGPAAWLSGVICALSTLGVVCLLLRAKVSGRLMAAVLIVCVGADIGLNLAAEAAGIPSGHLHAGLNIALLGMAGCGGVLLSCLVEKKSYIIPIALAAGLADIWSVTLGVTREVIQSRIAMNHFLFHFPVIGKGVSPLIGAADFVLAAFFLSLAHRFHLPAKETQVVVGAAFTVAITLAVVTGYGTPVLPVMGILFILVHYKEIKVIDPGEKRKP